MAIITMRASVAKATSARKALRRKHVMGDLLSGLGVNLTQIDGDFLRGGRLNRA
jgi:hypothetical protein